jgi:hypothetical protein
VQSAAKKITTKLLKFLDSSLVKQVVTGGRRRIGDEFQAIVGSGENQANI